MPRQLALSSWSFAADHYAGQFSLFDLPSRARVSGFDVVECNDFMLPPPRLSRLFRRLYALLPGAPADLWRYRGSVDAQLRFRFSAEGVRCLCWTVNSDFSVRDAHWPMQRAYVFAGARIAAALGAPLLRVILGGDEHTPATRDAVVADRLAAVVRTIAHRRPPLNVVVENHWGLSTDVHRMVQILDGARQRLPAPIQARLGACFDPANMPPDARQAGWRALAPLTAHAHFKVEFDGQGALVGPTPADWMPILRDGGYAGAFTLEATGELPAADLVRRSLECWRSACP